MPVYYPSHCPHCGGPLLGGATRHDPGCPLYPISVQGWIEGGIPGFLLEGTTMTTREIIDELAAISKGITADHANPNLPAKQALVRAVMAVESLRVLLIEDLRRASGDASWTVFPGSPPPPPIAELHFGSRLSPEDVAAVEGYLAEKYGVRPPESGSWRDRPPLL